MLGILKACGLWEECRSQDVVPLTQVGFAEIAAQEGTLLLFHACPARKGLGIWDYSKLWYLSSLVTDHRHVPSHGIIGPIAKIAWTLTGFRTLRGTGEFLRMSLHKRYSLPLPLPADWAK